MWGGMDGHSWGWGFGPLFMVLFWGLVVIGIVALVQYLLRGPGNAPRGKNALDILKERYARGEIDKDEFERKKRDLEA